MCWSHILVPGLIYRIYALGVIDCWFLTACCSRARASFLAVSNELRPTYSSDPNAAALYRTSREMFQHTHLAFRQPPTGKNPRVLAS